MKEIPHSISGWPRSASKLIWRKLLMINKYWLTLKKIIQIVSRHRSNLLREHNIPCSPKLAIFQALFQFTFYFHTEGFQPNRIIRKFLVCCFCSRYLTPCPNADLKRQTLGYLSNVLKVFKCVFMVSSNCFRWNLWHEIKMLGSRLQPGRTSMKRSRECTQYGPPSKHMKVW